MPPFMEELDLSMDAARMSQKSAGEGAKDRTGRHLSNPVSQRNLKMGRLVGILPQPFFLLGVSLLPGLCPSCGSSGHSALPTFCARSTTSFAEDGYTQKLSPATAG